MLYTSKQIAKQLAVSERTIQHLRKEGLPHLRLRYAVIRYDWNSVLAWLEEKYGANYTDLLKSALEQKKDIESA